MIKKGFKKTSNVVFKVQESGDLVINKKHWGKYFVNIILIKKMQILIDSMKKQGHEIAGVINCSGGGECSQLKAISDAIMRACGLKPKQDTRYRRRNRPGWSGVNKGAVHNKR